MLPHAAAAALQAGGEHGGEGTSGASALRVLKGGQLHPRLPAAATTPSRPAAGASAETATAKQQAAAAKRQQPSAYRALHHAPSLSRHVADAPHRSRHWVVAAPGATAAMGTQAARYPTRHSVLLVLMLLGVRRLRVLLLPLARHCHCCCGCRLAVRIATAGQHQAAVCRLVGGRGGRQGRQAHHASVHIVDNLGCRSGAGSSKVQAVGRQASQGAGCHAGRSRAGHRSNKQQNPPPTAPTLPRKRTRLLHLPLLLRRGHRGASQGHGSRTVGVQFTKVRQDAPLQLALAPCTRAESSKQPGSTGHASAASSGGWGLRLCLKAYVFCH